MGCSRLQEPISPIRFMLGRTLGSGSFGEVKIGTHLHSKHDYAIKIIPYSTEKEDVQLYKNEVMALKAMRGACDNLVGFVQTLKRPDYWYIVMELAEGGDLTSRLPYTEDRAKVIVHQILNGLKAMHQKSLVHRDIKPENIVFKTTAEDSPVMIIDFGFAAFCNVPGSPLDMECGTDGYMAPEMSWVSSYGCEVDIWSLGILVWHMFFATEPSIRFEFEGDTNCKLEAFPGNLSDHAKSFITSCLNGDPETRMTAAEALEHPWFSPEVVDVPVLEFDGDGDVEMSD